MIHLKKQLISLLLLFLYLPLAADSIRSVMLEKFSSGDWIQQAELLDYASRYKVNAAAPQIKKILDSKEHSWLRGQALKTLVKILPKEAGVLTKKYMNDPQLHVKIAVAQVCSDLPSETAAPILKKLLKEKGLVHYHALASYAKHRGEQGWSFSASSLKKVPDDSLVPGVRALGLIANDDALKVLKSLIKETKFPQRILQGLRGINKPDLIPLYFDLFSKPGQKLPVKDLLDTLKAYERQFLIKEFHKFIASGNDQNISLVAQLISYDFRESGLLDALQKALKKTEDVKALKNGLTALSTVNPDKNKDLYTENLKHPKNEVRIVAVNCLGQCESVELFKAMKQILKDPDIKVRMAAILSLGKAKKEQAPQNLGDYFKSNLLSKDQIERRTAISIVSKNVSRENSESLLPVLDTLLSQYNREEGLILAKALFRLLPVEESKPLIRKLGFVTDWHVVGSFPSGVATTVEKENGIDVVFPPEKKVDLNEKYLVKYNSHRTRHGSKKILEKEIGWVKANVDNEDGILYMSKAGRNELLLPARQGVSYAFTEINIPQKTAADLKIYVAVSAKQKVWINGKLLSFEFKLGRNQKFVTKTSKVKLQSGKNKILIKIESNDGGWVRDVTSKRFFNFLLLDSKGKVVKWSQP